MTPLKVKQMTLLVLNENEDMNMRVQVCTSGSAGLSKPVPALGASVIQRPPPRAPANPFVKTLPGSVTGLFKPCPALIKCNIRQSLQPSGPNLSFEPSRKV